MVGLGSKMMSVIKLKTREARKKGCFGEPQASVLEMNLD